MGASTWGMEPVISLHAKLQSHRVKCEQEPARKDAALERQAARAGDAGAAVAAAQVFEAELPGMPVEAYAQLTEKGQTLCYDRRCLRFSVLRDCTQTTQILYLT